MNSFLDVAHTYENKEIYEKIYLLKKIKSKRMKMTKKTMNVCVFEILCKSYVKETKKNI